jgi:polygalacturonase
MDPVLRAVVENSPGSAEARDLLDRPGEPRPILIGACRDVLVEGLHIKDSATWTLHILYCEEVEIRGVTIRNAQPHIHAPCTDGIDIDSSRNVRVRHCDIACHDDGICLKSGRGRDGARVNRPTENVTIHDCVVGEAHSLVGLGTEFSGGIRNVLIRDCRSEGSRAALRFKSNIGNGGTIENVVAENVVCVKTEYPIHFRLRDAFGVREGKPGAAAYLPEPDGIPHYRNITFRNVTATGATACLGTIAYDDQTFDNVVFDKVSLQGEAGLQISNARNWDLRGLTHAACSSGPLFDVKQSENILYPFWHEVGK